MEKYYRLVVVADVVVEEYVISTAPIVFNGGKDGTNNCSFQIKINALFSGVIECTFACLSSFKGYCCTLALLVFDERLEE